MLRQKFKLLLVRFYKIVVSGQKLLQLKEIGVLRKDPKKKIARTKVWLRCEVRLVQGKEEATTTTQKEGAFPALARCIYQRHCSRIERERESVVVVVVLAASRATSEMLTRQSWCRLDEQQACGVVVEYCNRSGCRMIQNHKIAAGS